MDTTDSTLQPRQRGAQAPDHVVAAALAVLAECDGSTREASRQTGIPETTLRHWRDGDYRTVPAQLAIEQRAKRASKWDAVQDAAVAQALAKLPEASARDAAVVAGIAVDKAALLRGDGATTTDPEAAARIEMFRARYAASQALHVHVHLAPPPGVPGPAPIVLEPLGSKAIEGAERPEGESAGS